MSLSFALHPLKGFTALSSVIAVSTQADAVCKDALNGTGEKVL